MAVTISQTFLVLGDLDSFEEDGSSVLSAASLWEFVCYFLMISLGLWGWRRKTTEVGALLTTSYQRHMQATELISVDFTLITWLRECLSRMSAVKLLHSSLERSHSVPPALKERRVMLQLHEGGAAAEVIWTLAAQETCLPH